MNEEKDVSWLQDTITFPKINTEAHLSDFTETGRTLDNENQTDPSYIITYFCGPKQVTKSSFTHCKMRLYHLLYGFPVCFCEDKGKCHAFKDTIFPIVNVKQVVYELMLILPIRKLTQSLNGLLQMVSRKGTRN